MSEKEKVYFSLPEEVESLEKDARRSFLKKAVYAAPTIVALGALMKPTESKAGFGKPPSGPNWN